ncbi:hypothetical protein Ddye_020969 [Dipteronia dyeriana]|uniref:Uncharacterized protein n=1 Tax=Dipteronia dyeriana TaxID=168575 RepID=A0AAD9U0R0_9ROSI|nr:hypothetical protein Ddye_020969 [Dipteronia dyeriana]
MKGEGLFYSNHQVAYNDQSKQLKPPQESRQAHAYLTQQSTPKIASSHPSPMASQYSGLVRLRALIRACVDCVSNQPTNTGILDKSVGYGVVVPTQEHRDAATEDVEASFLLLCH